MNKPKTDITDYIVPLSINGLEGRMLRMPSAAKPGTSESKREVLFVYGHHSSLERWRGVMEVLTEYGNVTMPDLPGFGGMDSFYKIGQKPTIDNLADYLAAFIKWRYRRKKLVLAGMSFGFVVVTRMLQRYPELVDKVEMLISIVGFAHYQDFIFTPLRLRTYRFITGILAHNPVAWFLRHVTLTAPVIRLAYAYTYSGKNKFAHVAGKDEHKAMMDVEVVLWQSNDVRTHWSTAHQFLALNNCGTHVDLPVWHVSTDNDHYFNNTIIEQHMRTIFTDFHNAPAEMPNHAPSVIADAEMAAPLFPDNLRRALADLP